MRDRSETCSKAERGWLKVVLGITAVTALLVATSFSSAGPQLAKGPKWVYLTTRTVTTQWYNPGSSDASFASSDRSIAAEGSSSSEDTAEGSSDSDSSADSDGSTDSGDGGSSVSSGSSSGRKRTRRGFVADVSKCQDFACLRAAHAAGTGGSRFNFPHFMIVGWQKCATTSLFKYLITHPQVVEPRSKEPEFFTRTCNYDPANCDAGAQAQYLANVVMKEEAVASRMGVAAFEASTHYGKAGEAMIRGLRETLPWLRVIASMRDPISRAISLLAHADEKGGWGKKSSCLAELDVMTCIRDQLTDRISSHAPNGNLQGYANYSYPLSQWVAAFPLDQIHLLQYEHLTSEEHQAEALWGVKAFLGLDQKAIGNELGLYNHRKDRIKPQGWPMRREDYASLVELVRPDGIAVARILDETGLGSGKQFVANWEAVWRDNLENNCDRKGDCLIQLS